ncbi:diacylglycerol/lipid kinase family protein [Microbacterium sp. YY-03]|uniref:diacylglycerol/lipid kinase family protein n=1 Tax=Microbacterium sp. YY-03 TaxID=3421636 RepID=UPI003D171B0D
MSDAQAPGSKRAALIYNPIKVDFSVLSEELLEQSAKARWATPLFLETTVEDLGQQVTAEALELGATHILVAGGDGTVRAVMEALADTDVPLTIIPSGTGNLLARNLHLPLNRPHEAIAATFGDTATPVDVGFAEVDRPAGHTERHAFVVMAGMGLDAAMIQNTSAKMKKRVGWIAYVSGAARSLKDAKPFKATYQLAGHREHTGRVHSILFANCGQLPGGIALLPDASITDGLLDVAVFKPTGFFGWVFVWRAVWWDHSVLSRFSAGRTLAKRRAGKSSHVHFLQGRWLEAATTEPQPIELDGDEFGEALRLRCSVEPGAVTVMIPAAHKNGS